MPGPRTIDQRPARKDPRPRDTRSPALLAQREDGLEPAAHVAHRGDAVPRNSTSIHPAGSARACRSGPARSTCPARRCARSPRPAGDRLRRDLGHAAVANHDRHAGKRPTAGAIDQRAPADDERAAATPCRARRARPQGPSMVAIRATTAAGRRRDRTSLEEARVSIP